MNIKELKNLIKKQLTVIREQDDGGEPIDPQQGPAVSDLCDQNSFFECANSVSLDQKFVNNNPSNFLNNMWNRFSGTGGCSFLLQRLARHQDHMDSGMAGPQGNKPMGPKWEIQKQGKIDWYGCIMQKCGCDPNSAGALQENRLGGWMPSLNEIDN